MDMWLLSRAMPLVAREIFKLDTLEHGSFAGSAAPSQGEDNKRENTREEHCIARKTAKGEEGAGGHVFRAIHSESGGFRK